MKEVAFNVHTENREFEIIPIGDTHIGDDNFNLQLLNDTITYVLEKPNRYVILLGDIINNATKNSPSNIYNEKLSPTDQIIYASKILAPIKDRIISVCAGNHEERTMKDSGIDLTEWLCSELGCADRYDPSGCIDFIRASNLLRSKPTEKRNFESHFVFTLYHNHGKGGGKRVGSKANNMEDLTNIIVDVDCLVVGHTHSLMAFKQDYFILDKSHNKVKQKTRLCVNANAFLRYKGGYAERMGLKPSTMEVPRIIVHFSGGHNGNDVSCQVIL